MRFDDSRIKLYCISQNCGIFPVKSVFRMAFKQNWTKVYELETIRNVKDFQ